MSDAIIPAAAVDAVAERLFREYGPSIGWDSPAISEPDRQSWRDEALDYIAPAAPHIVAAERERIAAMLPDLLADTVIGVSPFLASRWPVEAVTRLAESWRQESGTDILSRIEALQ